MYPAGTNSAQTAAQGQAVPTTNPAYSSYQPTPTQGYQASLLTSVPGQDLTPQHCVNCWARGGGERSQRSWPDTHLACELSHAYSVLRNWNNLVVSLLPSCCVFCDSALLPIPVFSAFQNAAAPSQTQAIPAMTQAPQSGGTIGYMGSQSVSMGYQPYNMQVRKCFI